MKDLEKFIPKDNSETRARFPHGYDGTPTWQASEGTVQQFIQEQYDKRFLSDLQYDREWRFIQSQLEKGKPVLYGDKLINPVKLDLTEYKRKKEGK